METAMTTIGSAITTCLGYVETVLSAVVANPVLVVVFAGTVFVPLAISIFRRIKNASEG